MSVVDVSDLARALLDRFQYAGVRQDAVEALLGQCEERSLANGEVLCKERSHGNEMYVLVQGRVRLTRLDRLGEPQLLTTLHAPDLIGPLALIDNAVRSATVTADGAILVRVLPRLVYATLWNAPTLAGSALRRLLLAALHEQLTRAHQAWTGRLNPAPPPRARVPTVVVEDDADDVDDELLFGLKRDITE